MKKFILLLVLFFLLSSKKCINKSYYDYSFEKSYTLEQEDKSIHDLDSILRIYDLDTISIADWITLELNKEDSCKIVQRSIHTIDYKTIVTYNTYVFKDSVSFEIRVRRYVENPE